MSQELIKTQSLTALENTKRGYGMWRGEVIHPDDPRMDEIIASDEPITDTKGLGLRYVSVRGSRVIPHFRVHDPDNFSAALDRVFPAIHDAVVRLIAEDIRAGGFEALSRWCAGSSLPEPFDVAEVAVERRCTEGDVVYRPDICVLHSEGGRIELEVVNTHAPAVERLDAAWAAGHLVLSLRIRDLVEQIVFSEGRGVVPDDVALRDMLRGRRFRLCGRDAVPEAVRVVWRDLNMSAYAMNLRQMVRVAFSVDNEEVVEPVAEILNGIMSGDLSDKVKRPGALRELRDLFESVADGAKGRGRWLREFRHSLEQLSLPHPLLVAVGAEADSFLDQFLFVEREPAGVRKLRYALAAVWFCRRRNLDCCAHSGSLLLRLRAPKSSTRSSRPLVATEQGIC